ncbi:hypothetical protein AZSP09_38620 (plasmid) [Azospira sp. I09]|nr:hypothetical protein AZSP09_38620 [Azospira sp. I09]
MWRTDMWSKIKEATTALFGHGHVEFLEMGKAIVGVANADQGFKDPRLIQLFDVLQEGLPQGGVLSIHHRQPQVIFIAGTDRRLVSQIELQRGFREAA